MKRLLLSMAILGLLASPAMATGGGQMGPGPGMSSLVVDAPYSAIYTTTFYFHLDPVLYPNGMPLDYIHFAFLWDTTEIQVLSVTSKIGGFFTHPGWITNNYASALAFQSQNGYSAVQSYFTSFQSFTGPNSTYFYDSVFLPASTVIPFFQVQYHVFNPVDDGYFDLGPIWLDLPGGFYTYLTTIVNTQTWVGHNGTAHISMTGTWTIVTSYTTVLPGWTVSTRISWDGLIAVTPEPTSGAFLAGGLLAIGGGLWRRRRR
jgi:hypothetical protein